MTEESARKQGGGPVADQSYGSADAVYEEEEDEAWRSFLENPLAVATKAMRSVHGEEEGPSALSLLCDYYKLPRDKRSAHLKTESVPEETDSSTMLLPVCVEVPLLAARHVPLHSVIHPGRQGNSPYPQCTAALSPSPPYTEQVFPEDDFLPLASISSDQRTIYSPAGAQFDYVLEAPQSLRPRSSTGPLSYLNKGQFYPVVLRCQGPPLPHNMLRSVVMLVFGEEKPSDDQLKHWRYWQSRQHTVKQRCLDMDYKESFNTVSTIEEIAYNAISFTWDSRNEARVLVSVNCLSTDFSPQKGVRGLPLSLQVDTYDCVAGGDRPLHRACGQVKVFCDKGAERKLRDEDRKTTRRSKSQDHTPGERDQQYLDVTVLKDVSDLDTPPVLFIPDNLAVGRQSCTSEEMVFHSDYESAAKRLKTEEQRVLLYVRRENEEVFDALMLKAKTLSSLLDAVMEKYHVPAERISKVYKRCKKGVMVTLDDSVVSQCCHEDAFHLSMERSGAHLLLTFTEL